MEEAPSSAAAEQQPTIAELENQYAEALAEARAAHDGLFSGATSEGDLDLAYRREAEAKAALDKARAQERSAA